MQERHTQRETRLWQERLRPQQRFGWLLGGGLVSWILMVLVGTALPTDWVTTLSQLWLMTTLALGWSILAGYGGTLNFSTTTFFGIGAYTSGLLAVRAGLSPWMTVPLSGLAALGVGLLLGWMGLRLQGPFFALFTLLSTFLGEWLATNLPLTGGATGLTLPLLPYDTWTLAQVFADGAFALLIGAVLFVRWIEQHRFGWVLVALGEDEEAVELLGLPSRRYKLVAFLLGALISGVVGGITAWQMSFIEPQGIFSVQTTLTVICICLVGGLGRWQGPLLGAPLVVLLSQLLRIGLAQGSALGAWLPAEGEQVLFGLVLLLVALCAPQGILGWWDTFRQRQARASSEPPQIEEDRREPSSHY